MADRTKLPFVDATISEIQRIRNIRKHYLYTNDGCMLTIFFQVPMSVIHVVAEDTQLKGYNIPKGTWIFPIIGAVTDDSKYWENPTDFNPRRFLDEFGNYLKQEMLIPFSMGEQARLALQWPIFWSRIRISDLDQGRVDLDLDLDLIFWSWDQDQKLDQLDPATGQDQNRDQ